MGAQLGTSSMRDELFIKSDAFVPESRAFLQDTSSISQYHFKTTYNLLKRNLPPSIGATYSFIRERDFPLVVNIQIFFSLSLSFYLYLSLHPRGIGRLETSLAEQRERKIERKRNVSALLVVNRNVPREESNVRARDKITPPLAVCAITPAVRGLSDKGLAHGELCVSPTPSP